MTLTAGRIKARAAELGFVACGICDLAPSARADALDDWLAKGRAGVMRYLHRRAKKRKHPATITPGAVRAVVVLENYFHPDGPEEASPPRVARYARGMDYHVVVLARLRVLAEWMLAHGATLAHAWCDDGPLPERELAERAGLGWIGRNTMLIRPGTGSWTLIGTILTDLPLEVDAPLATDHCGTCTRCLDACPTQAFVGDRVLDATRCISYLTIEQDGPIPAEFADRLSGWAFGCDICNEVCPWNERFAAPTTVEELRPREGTGALLATGLDTMDEAAFQARFADSPLARAGLEGMRRNVRAALGRGDAAPR